MAVYVEFETLEIPKEASSETGKVEYDLVDFIICMTDDKTITPISWDRFQNKARFQDQYDAWKRGEEAPLEGTNIKSWPQISKQMAETMWRFNVRTIEDLASANDSTLDSIGAGARMLQQQAQSWLEAANNTGKVSEELRESRTQMADMKREIEDLKATLAARPKPKTRGKQQAEATA